MPEDQRNQPRETEYPERNNTEHERKNNDMYFEGMNYEQRRQPFRSHPHKRPGSGKPGEQESNKEA